MSIYSNEKYYGIQENTTIDRLYMTADDLKNNSDLSRVFSKSDAKSLANSIQKKYNENSYGKKRKMRDTEALYIASRLKRQAAGAENARKFREAKERGLSPYNMAKLKKSFKENHGSSLREYCTESAYNNFFLEVSSTTITD